MKRQTSWNLVCVEVLLFFVVIEWAKQELDKKKELHKMSYLFIENETAAHLFVGYFLDRWC